MGTPLNGQGSRSQPSEQELLQQIRSHPPGDPRRQSACEQLVARYEPVVRSCANRYRNSPETTEDLMQAGYVGLMKAINNYDPAVGHSLIAYALPCVTGEIKRHFRDRRWHIRVHRPAQELRLAIREATGVLAQQLARTPTTADLARHLQVSEEEITDARLASQVFQIDSLDAPAGQVGSELTFADLAGDDDPALGHAVDMQAVWQHCQDLPKREQRMLMMRFYGNMTQTEIGEQLGISQMHVSRLMRHALGYLRERLTITSPASDGTPAPSAGEGGMTRTSPTSSPTVAVVTLPAEIDATTAEDVSNQLKQALASGAATVIADMTRATFIDTSGIRVLVLFHKAAAAKDAEFRVATSSPVALRTLSILKLDTVLSIYPTVEQAQAGSTASQPTPDK